MDFIGDSQGWKAAYCGTPAPPFHSPGPGAPWWGGCKGACVVFWPPCQPEAGRRELSEGVCIKRGHRASSPLSNPRGFRAGGESNAGSTKGTSVVYHGSSWKTLRRQGGDPLDPGFSPSSPAGTPRSPPPIADTPATL